MRRLIFVVFAIATVSCGLAAGAAANTTQFVSMTFAEPIHPSTTCPGFPDVACGAGEVVPLGQASETLVFGAGCGGACDLRTINLAGGSLILEETISDVSCPGGVCRPGPLEIGSGKLTDMSSAAPGFSKVQRER